MRARAQHKSMCSPLLLCLQKVVFRLNMESCNYTIINLEDWKQSSAFQVCLFNQ